MIFVRSLPFVNILKFCLHFAFPIAKWAKKIVTIHTPSTECVCGTDRKESRSYTIIFPYFHRFLMCPWKIPQVSNVKCVNRNQIEPRRSWPSTRGRRTCRSGPRCHGPGQRRLAHVCSALNRELELCRLFFVLLLNPFCLKILAPQIK